ncbi:MAG: aldo/keto reductase [Phycisphaerae bacterium]
MEKRQLGRTGLSVSVLGYGSAAVGSAAAADRNAAAETLRTLLDGGVNLVDTAQVYPGSEEFIGRELADRRDELVLVSKCGHHDVLPDGRLRSRRIGQEDIDQALRRLRTDYLDVMLLHSYDRDLLEQGEALDVLVRAREAGKIGHIGYSGDNETAAYAASLDCVSVVEMSVNLADQANLESVLPEARKRDIGVIVKRPLANAAWRLLQSDDGVEPHVQPYVERLRTMGLAPANCGLGEADWAELALRFVLSLDGLHVAIVGTTNPRNAQANLAAAQKGPLPADAIGCIRNAFEQARRQAEEPWPGQN